MTLKRNTIAIALMGSSILLLIVLQFFWLRSVYQDAANDFRKEASTLFRNTVFAMHDSLIEKSIQPLAGDSVFRTFKRNKAHFSDDHNLSPIEADSLMHVRFSEKTEKTATVEIYSSGNRDTLTTRLLRPLVKRMQVDPLTQSFVIRIGGDSLKVDSIRKQFQHSLDDAGIEASFQIHAFRNNRIPREPRPLKGKYVSEIVRLNPLNEYAVSFSEIEPLLIRSMTPQILFSVFLSLLTFASFFVMYRSLRSQQKLMELKNDFISNVTHELKTPVATVSVALEALRNFNALNDAQRTSEYLEIAQNELNRLTLMTDKILKTSVFESRGVDIEFEQVNLNDLISEVLTSMKLVFEKRQIDLSYERHGTEFTLAGAQEHLTNVLYNLIDNAIKYGGEGRSIKIKLTESAEYLILSVCDSGPGIAPEYQKKIFDKFFRVPSGDIHNTKGYGLGLSYVASVVENHKGKIRVESEPGKGSCFVMDLPKKHED